MSHYAEKAEQFFEDRKLEISYQNLSEDQQDRMNRLLDGDYVLPASAAPTTFLKAFENFCSVCPQWRESSAWLFWKAKPLAHLDPGSFLVMRLQTSGLCYMQGPVTLHHYLIAWNTGKPCKIIDAAALIAKTFGRRELRDFILLHRGGSPLDILRRITGLTDAGYKSFRYVA